jgi:hypothetical protein
MTHKMNPAILQKILNSAHDDITSALLYLMDIVIVTNPGSARTGLHEMQMQFEQMLAQTSTIKLRIGRWTKAFPELTEANRQDTKDFLAEFFDFHAEAEDGDEENDEHDASMDDDFSDEWEENTSDEATNDASDDIAPASKDSLAFALPDADLARLFGISEASATAGVQETGYLDIFGAWHDGRRPGPYKRPTPPKIEDDPDYNVPGAAS